MNKNDRIELKITDMGVNGEGIGKCGGMTFFVKDALIGDEILARVIKLKKNYGYARLEKLIVPSPDRVRPRCALHRSCGGCQLQAMSYQKQLEYKVHKVRNDLIRLGGFSEEEINAVMLPIVGMDEPYRYRNKAQYPVGRGRDGAIVIGFYAARTHCIIPVEDCMLGDRENERILACVRHWMEEFCIAPYDERDGSGLVRHVLIRSAFVTGERMVCLVVNGSDIPAEHALIDALREVPGMTSVCLNFNRSKTNVILGAETVCIWGRPYITDHIRMRDPEDFSLSGPGIACHISPQSFYQVNSVQTEKLYSTALDYAGLSGRECVWDLYCGIGTISLFLSQRAKQVFGVEVVPQAIEDARANASRNNITNAQFWVGRAEEIRPGDLPQPDVIVVDPPRKGCDAACLDTMLAVRPKRIVYVSCDPATLARDLRILADGGYELKKLRPFDQFCQTLHVETVVQLSLKTDTPHIDVTMQPGEESNYNPQEKATYQKIKACVKEKHGLNVSSLYIAQIKDKCGLDKRLNYNLAKSEDAKQPKCTPEKEAAIMDAFRHFGMIE